LEKRTVTPPRPGGCSLAGYLTLSDRSPPAWPGRPGWNEPRGCWSAGLRAGGRAREVEELGAVAKGLAWSPRASAFLLDRKFCPPDTRRLEDGHDMRTAAEVRDHADVRTTMIYTHVLNRGGQVVRSPATRPGAQCAVRRCGRALAEVEQQGSGEPSIRLGTSRAFGVR
jgi:hypothetical protein